MSLNENKINAYLGFAIKSRKIEFGTDDVLKSKNSKIILASSSLSQNAMQKIENFSNEKSIGYFCISDEIFAKAFGEKNVKVVAVTDEGLANAIKNYIE